MMRPARRGDTSSPPGRAGRLVLDLTNACLWRGARRVALRPKDAVVLRSLVEGGGRLVSKETLASAAWPEVAVTEAVLKACINRLRAALGDDARSPRDIETVHRQGYRLVAGIALGDGAMTAKAVPAHGLRGKGRVVGRQAELARLAGWFAAASRGTRQVVHRLSAELTLRAARRDLDANQSLERALALSRAQQSRSLELRAAMSRCRWAPGPEERRRAQGTLAEVYGWFSEGFDTRDLREARSLLRTS